MLFSYVPLITQKKRGETLCLIEFDKMLDDIGKPEINWLIPGIINSSLRMLYQVEKYTKTFASRNDFQPNFSSKSMTYTPLYSVSQSGSKNKSEE